MPQLCVSAILYTWIESVFSQRLMRIVRVNRTSQGPGNKPKQWQWDAGDNKAFHLIGAAAWTNLCSLKVTELSLGFLLPNAIFIFYHFIIRVTKKLQGQCKFKWYESKMPYHLQARTQVMLDSTHSNQLANTQLFQLVANITCTAKIIKSLIMHIKHHRRDN